MSHIREIALTTSFINAFEKNAGAFEINAFWEHAFGTGMVSKTIAQKIGYDDLEKAYISGIIHNLGMVFLSTYLHEEFQEVLDNAKGKHVRLIDEEIRKLGTSHCEIGLCMAENGISRGIL